MSLFPAYAEKVDESLSTLLSNKETLSSPEVLLKDDISVDLEESLLASDDCSEEDAPLRPAKIQCMESSQRDYYFDNKIDYGNLRVSTLYYPGRPEYCKAREAGEAGAKAKRRRARRYYDLPAPADEAARDRRESEARADALLSASREAPEDEARALRAVAAQLGARGMGAALRAAGGAGGARLRALRAWLREELEPPHAVLRGLREELGGALEAEALARLALRGEAGAVERAGAGEAYARVLLAHAAWLRGGGHAERLTALVELLAEVALPSPARLFPPPRDEAAERAVEERLQEFEDLVSGSGAPLRASWARVERARAAAHWRAAAEGGGGGGALDPARRPRPAELCALLRVPRSARAAELLELNLLRMGGVALVWCAEWTRGGGAWRLACGEEDAGEFWALALAHCGARLPSPPSSARVARLAALLLDPPHSLSDDTGYLSWLEALWADALRRAERPGQRAALLRWRLAWLAARARIGASAAACRASAKRDLQAYAGDCAEPFAEFARLEAACGSPAAARRVALRTLRAHLPGASPLTALQLARLAGEQLGRCGQLWATASAATGVALPADELLERPPPAELLRSARERCEASCEALDAAQEEEGDAVPLWRALLPHASEWDRARALLAPERSLPSAQGALAARAEEALAGGAGAGRWRRLEAAAEELARRADGLAPALAAYFPHNLTLQLSAARARVWRAPAQRLAPLPPGDARALAQAAAPLLWPPKEAGDGPFSAAECARALRALERAARRGGCGCARRSLRALRTELGARTAPPSLGAEALPPAAALDKWGVVRACAAGAAGLHADSCADALLDAGARLHALPAEVLAAAD